MVSERPPQSPEGLGCARGPHGEQQRLKRQQLACNKHQCPRACSRRSRGAWSSSTRTVRPLVVSALLSWRRLPSRRPLQPAQHLMDLPACMSLACRVGAPHARVQATLRLSQTAPSTRGMHAPARPYAARSRRLGAGAVGVTDGDEHGACASWRAFGVLHFY